MRIGVASGLVLADPDGEVLGEAPGEAARLQYFAEPGQVIIAASTRWLAGDLFAYRDLGPLAVKGVVGPVAAWQVLGRKRSRQPLRGTLRRGGDPAGRPRRGIGYAAAGLAAGKVRGRAAWCCCPVSLGSASRACSPPWKSVGRRSACEPAVFLLTAASGQHAPSDRGALGAGGRIRTWRFAPNSVCVSWRPSSRRTTCRPRMSH